MPAPSHAVLMDRNYRFQRHIYDLTRRRYLIGRDLLIERLKPPPGGDVLEIGCGTAANLIAAAARYPLARLHGVDISSMMLATARDAIATQGLSERIRLQLADAARLDGRSFFGASAFDRVFFSYSLSMIPDWRAAIASAFAHVTPGGALHIVDFGEMNDMPRAAKAALRLWLRYFNVAPRDELRSELQTYVARGDASLKFSPLSRGYASYIELARRPAAASPISG